MLTVFKCLPPSLCFQFISSLALQTGESYNILCATGSMLTHLVDGSNPLCSCTGPQGEDGLLLALHPAGLQTVLPLSDHPGLRVRVIWDPVGENNT